MLFKIISIVGSLTFLSRILGYFRDLLIARVIGAGLISDCFFVAFKLPNLFRRILGEGAMNAAFIPVVSGVRTKSGNKSADVFFSNIFSFLLVALLAFVLILEILMPLIITLIAPGFSDNPEKFNHSINLTRLTFPFVLFICLTSLMGAYLNTLGKFASMAVTPIILNLSLIFTLLIFFKSENLFLISSTLSFVVSIAGIIQVIWMYYNIRRNKSKLSINFSFFKTFKRDKEITKFFKLLLPAILGNGAYQINLLIDMILASTLPDGSISFLYYADRVNQLPLGVLGIAIGTALLPVLSSQVKKKQKKEAEKSISKAIKFGILFSIPAFFGLLIFSENIISFLFFRGAFEYKDVQATSSALIALCCGLPAFIMIKILVIPFFANEDTKTPIKISLFCMSINLILNLILIREFLHVGLAISTSVSAWINFILLFYILNKNLNYSFDISIFKVFLKVSLASLTMSYIVLKTYEFMINNFEMYTLYNTNFILILCIIFGIIIYSVLMYFLGIKELEINKWKIQKK
tara:strand:- start:127 stop:1692 length:1566 start_codon:yes stop_codon:yes gene_type:complete